MGSRPIVIALSGPSTSGKTLMTSILYQILSRSTRCTILHEDDFYKTDSEIPMTEHGVRDWDCAEALNLSRLEEVLNQIVNGNATKEQAQSFQQTDHNNVKDETYKMLVPAIAHLNTVIDNAQGSFWPASIVLRGVVIIEGFLLHGKSISQTLSEKFDLRILLRTTFIEGKRRREQREGYKTIEGFWQDPPKYFEKTVWPNYIEEHSHLFVNHDVEMDEFAPEYDIHISPCSRSSREPHAILHWLINLVRTQPFSP